MAADKSLWAARDAAIVLDRCGRWMVHEASHLTRTMQYPPFSLLLFAKTKEGVDETMILLLVIIHGTSDLGCSH